METVNKKEVKYILTTEISPLRVVYVPDDSVEFDESKWMRELSKNLFSNTSPEIGKSFISTSIGQETMDFINSVAMIENTKYGEKLYKINGIEIKIERI